MLPTGTGHPVINWIKAFRSVKKYMVRPVGRGGAGGCMCTPLFYSSTLKLYSITARNIPTLVASTLAIVIKPKHVFDLNPWFRQA